MGCHPNRDTLPRIESAFAVDEVERSELPEGPSLCGRTSSAGRTSGRPAVVRDTGVSSSVVMERRAGSGPVCAALAALGVSAARLRSQPLRPVLVVAGVALAFAMTVAIVGGSLVARQQALGQALGSLPDSAQGFRVDRFGTPLSRQTYGREDHEVRRVLGKLSPGVARRVVFFRQLRVAGQLVEIAGVDRLAQVIRLRSGRLPRTCTPASCEVLQIGGGGRARLHQGDVRLDRVGVAELRDPGCSATSRRRAPAPPRRRPC